MIDVDKLLLVHGHQGGYYIPKIDREIVADYVRRQSDEIDRLRFANQKLTERLREAERKASDGNATQHTP